MTSNPYWQLDQLTLLFQETLLKTFGTSTRTNLMRLEFPLKLVFSQVYKTLIQELGSTLEITVHTGSLISFSTKSLKSIMAMDQMQFTILT